MTPTLVSKEKNLVKFTIEYTGEEFDAATQKVYLKNRDKITVPGFRKGKAPRSIIESRYGVGVFYEEAIDMLLNDAYPKALDELKLEPIARPEVDFGEDKIEKGKGFVVTISVEVEPEVTVKDYKGMAVNRKVHTVTEADVDERIESMQKRNARQIEITDEAAQLGDELNLDYAGFCGEEQFEGGTAEGQTLKLGSNTFIPGFEEQLVGAKVGDEKEVKVTFPAEYHAENLAGKDAVFKCKVNAIKREELPALDDEFAKDVSECDTLAELREKTKADLEASAERTKEYTGKDAAVAKLVEMNDFEVPEAMITMEQGNLMNEFAQNLSYQGLSMDMYLKYIQKTEDEMKEELKPTAVDRVKSRLALKAVAAVEGIEATAEEIEEEYGNMAKQYGMSLEEVKKALGGSSSAVTEDIISRKTVQFLYDNSVFTDISDAEEQAAE